MKNVEKFVYVCVNTYINDGQAYPLPLKKTDGFSLSGSIRIIVA